MMCTSISLNNFGRKFRTKTLGICGVRDKILFFSGLRGAIKNSTKCQSRNRSDIILTKYVLFTCTHGGENCHVQLMCTFLFGKYDTQATVIRGIARLISAKGTFFYFVVMRSVKRKRGFCGILCFFRREIANFGAKYFITNPRPNIGISLAQTKNIVAIALAKKFGSGH